MVPMWPAHQSIDRKSKAVLLLFIILGTTVCEGDACSLLLN
jgi:hypothetical protein